MLNNPFMLNADINHTIDRVIVKNFKVIDDSDFVFRNLTILTGENGSGKSSLIQAILLCGNPLNFNIQNYLNSLGIKELFNKNNNEDAYVSVLSQNKNLNFYIKKDELNVIFNYPGVEFLTYPDNLVYLNANRIGIQAYENFNPGYNSRDFGIFGDMITNYYENNKRIPIENYLVKNNSGYTLEAQVNFWLSYITNTDISFYSEKINFSQIQNTFFVNGNQYLPHNVGTGYSYLLKILVACLSAKKGNIIIIENPEIHLHPKSQEKLGEFFAFVASRGIQLIIETHNDHIINKISYEAYKNNISKDDVVIHYFSIPYKKTTILIDNRGHFIDEQGKPTQFPEGFFDATLKEVFEMNEDI